MFSIIGPEDEFRNSITLVWGLQNAILAKPEPCNPTIISALLNKTTCSEKLKSLNLMISKPFTDKNFLISCSFFTVLK